MPSALIRFTRTPVLLGLLAAMLLVLAAMHAFALPRMGRPSVTMMPGNMQMTQNLSPFLLHAYLPAYTLNNRFTVDYHNGEQAYFRIYPQNCVKMLTVNAIPVPYDEKAACDFTAGMQVDLKPYLKPGRNEIYLQSKASGAHMAPQIFTPDDPGLADALGYMLLALCTLTMALFTLRLTHDPYAALILAGAFLLFMKFFVRTSFMEFTMDMPGHLLYVLYVAQNGSWPRPTSGWQFYHPPLYYTLQAGTLRLANWLGTFDTASVLRCTSLLCFMTFLLFGMKILRRLLRHPASYYPALLLLLWYPGGILYSTRIDSHLLLYAFSGGFLYFLLRWLESRDIRPFCTALAFFGLALGTRTNALFLLPLLLLAAGHQWGRPWRIPKDYRRSAACGLALAIVLLGIVINFGRTHYYRMTENRYQSYIVGNYKAMSKPYRVENTPDKFLALDTVSYFTEPFWINTLDKTGRHYFWNSALKTSVLGQYGWAHPRLALAMTGWLLALALWLAGSTLLNYSALAPSLPLRMSLAALFVPLGLLALNRVLFPFTTSQDFRYIYPAVIGFAAWAGLIIEFYLNRGRIRLAGATVALILLFIGSGAMFYASQ